MTPATNNTPATPTINPGNTTPAAADRVRDTAAGAWQATRDTAAKAYETTLSTAKSTIDSADAQIANIPEATKAAANSALTSAKSAHEAAASKLAELRTAGEKSVVTMTDSLNTLMTRLNDSVKALADTMPR